MNADGNKAPNSEAVSESKSSSESKSESNTTSPSIPPLREMQGMDGLQGLNGSQGMAVGNIELNGPSNPRFNPSQAMARSVFDMLPPAQQLEHWMGYNNLEFQQYMSSNLKLTPRSPQYTM